MTAKQPSRPVAPSGLGSAGKSLWARLTGPYVFEPHELPVVEAACRQADDLERLRQAVELEGATVPGSKGQPIVHPAVTEARLGRLVLTRLLGELAIPSEDAPETPMTAAQRRAQKASRARWNRKAAGNGTA